MLCVCLQILLKTDSAYCGSWITRQGAARAPERTPLQAAAAQLARARGCSAAPPPGRSGLGERQRVGREATKAATAKRATPSGPTPLHII